MEMIELRDLVQSEKRRFNSEELNERSHIATLRRGAVNVAITRITDSVGGG